MSAQDKTLTVVIPAFNAEDSIAAAIASAQDAGAAEIIVVDDGSSDTTPSIASALGVLLIQQENAGAAHARRAGIARAAGDCIILLDADDLLISDGVRRSVDLLVTGDYAVAIGMTVGVSHGVKSTMPPWPEGVTLDSLIARGYSPAPPASICWARDVLIDVVTGPPPGLWPRFAEDFEFLIRGAQRGTVVQHRVPSAEYSWDGGKSSADPLASIRCAETIRLHYAALEGVPVAQKSLRQLRAMAARRRAAALLHRRSRVRKVALLLKSVVLDPSPVPAAIKRRLPNTLMAARS
jgi:hypothetical protein